MPSEHAADTQPISRRLLHASLAWPQFVTIISLAYTTYDIVVVLIIGQLHTEGTVILSV